MLWLRLRFRLSAFLGDLEGVLLLLLRLLRYLSREKDLLLRRDLDDEREELFERLLRLVLRLLLRLRLLEDDEDELRRFLCDLERERDRDSLLVADDDSWPFFRRC